ncbi:MAG: ATP-binding protein [Cyclobacteriaceae bacterium]
MIKIAVTGPESSGKTTLASALASKYHVPWVQEYSREYLTELSGPYQEEDLLAIAHGQVALESKTSVSNPPLLICDTDMTVMAIWSLVRYGRLNPGIALLEQENLYHHTLLCKPDIPWEPGPLRENPNDRDELYKRYYDRLTKLKKPFTIIEGTEETRLKTAVSAIDCLISP